MAPAPLTLMAVAERVLAAAKTPLTFNEIWDHATTSSFAKQLGARGKTPAQSLGAQLYVDVRDNPDSKFLKIGTRPARFWLKARGTPAPAKAGDVGPPVSVSGYTERDLHPFLVYFARTQLSANCKTIFHEKAKKSGFNQWLYPDLVGIVLTGGAWGQEVVEFGRQNGRTLAKLFSFEMKRRLDFGNLREAFFQAVSNSSWAHEGYLVAAEVDEDPEFRNELTRLSDSFGIGVVRVDVEDPDSSETLLPARPRPELDWETVNKIANQSGEFREFLQAARNAVMTNKANVSEFDQVLEPEALLAALEKK